MDGSAVTWGTVDFGGDSTKMKDKLNGKTPVQKLFATERAFAAVLANGSVAT